MSPSRLPAAHSTQFDDGLPPLPPHEPAPLPLLCEPGMALRALLALLLALALGNGLVAASAPAWLLGCALAAAPAVAATLAWLVLACAGRPLLARWAPPGQVAALAALGGGLAWGAWLPMPLLGLATGGSIAGAAVAGWGAVAGGGFASWLQLRAQARMPAATLARLSELQSRVRPHFLFNTLNAAITLVRADPDRAEQVLEDLAELFRAALSAPGEATTLGEEVRLARLYLGIEAMRFGRRLQVDWDIAPGTEAARVPSLLLQPLVENAVHHGIEPSTEPGRIEIRSRVRQGRVWLQVLSTLPVSDVAGAGGAMAAAAPAGRHAGLGIGESAVRERLRLMHDLQAEFSAGPDRRGHYRVRVAVPAPLVR